MLAAQVGGSNRVPLRRHLQAFYFQWFRKWDLRGLATNIVRSAFRPPFSSQILAIQITSAGTTRPDFRDHLRRPDHPLRLTINGKAEPVVKVPRLARSLRPSMRLNRIHGCLNG
jgi:hypothetical protein